MVASRNKGKTVRDYSQAWDKKMGIIHQINLSVSYKINRAKSSHEIMLDVMNLTNNQAKLNEWYDAELDKKEYDTQMNIIPNIMYRIHF